VPPETITGPRHRGQFDHRSTQSRFDVRGAPTRIVNRATVDDKSPRAVGKRKLLNSRLNSFLRRRDVYSLRARFCHPEFGA
jgi:hypothetical protein